ncbi:Oxidoreductase [Balamuthia mandrillaris]
MEGRRKPRGDGRDGPNGLSSRASTKTFASNRMTLPPLSASSPLPPPPFLPQQNNNKKNKKKKTKKKKVKMKHQSAATEAKNKQKEAAVTAGHPKRRVAWLSQLETQTEVALTTKAKKRLREHDAALVEETGIRKLRRMNGKQQAKGLDSLAEAKRPRFISKLLLPRVCYICKQKYTKLHFFYDQLCPWCAALNYGNRFVTANLEGKVALVTGGRIKIGYQCCLRLLRCGAMVLATTRFPNDAAARFAAEEDFKQWKHNLHIYGLDLRDIFSLQRFLHYLTLECPRLDIIVNNAAQTIRRPPQYYAHLLDKETVAPPQLPAALRNLVNNSWNQEHVVQLLPQSAHSGSSGSSSTSSSTSRSSVLQLKSKTCSSCAEQRPVPSSSLPYATALTQVPLLDEDKSPETSQHFPLSIYDHHGQQVDTRPSNTWSQRLHEVSPIEALEAHLVNAIAPFTIASMLKVLMLKDGTEGDKFIINVSSMEGKFNRLHKDERHPHTNMAKASLNMLTRSSALDYARSNIFMNSVDTGWITDEHPQEKMARYGFQPPLDEVDGMARILHPVFDGLNGGTKHFGLFFKDYSPTSW